MTKVGRKSTWAAIGMVLLLAIAIVPAISGAASPATASSAAVTSAPAGCAASTSSSGGHSSGPSDTQWSYGGEGWSNWSVSYHHFTFSYNSTFGWTVVFTVITNSTTGVTLLEEQRTLGMTVWANLTSPNVTANYLYHAFEDDAAFANVTNHSTVYVNGSPVAALGLLNASVAACSTIHQAISTANKTATRTGFLNVTGIAEASISFSPSLGLIPLNLSGIEMWNSSSTATAAASWNVSYAYMELNGLSGSGSKAGSLSGTWPVNLTGYKFEARHSFSDRKPRVGVVLILQGPFNCYDGFILLPRNFDFFGTAVHGYDPYGFGSARISSESLYLSPGPGGFAVTAADQSFAAVNTGMNGFVGPNTLVASDALSSPATTVYGEPMPVSQAKAIDRSLAASPTLGTSPAPSHSSSMLASSEEFVAVVVGSVVVGIVAVVAALAWTSTSRRRAAGTQAVQQVLVPAGAANSQVARTTGGTNGSSQTEEPGRPQ